jgi:hypothetical protein
LKKLPKYPFGEGKWRSRSISRLLKNRLQRLFSLRKWRSRSIFKDLSARMHEGQYRRRCFSTALQQGFERPVAGSTGAAKAFFNSLLAPPVTTSRM